MEVYRITQEAFANDLSGNGARLFGGRWNNEGVFALYTAETRALAMLEILAHINFKLLNEKVYMLISIAVPDETMLSIEASDLSEGWNSPIPLDSTRKMGDNVFKSSDTLILKVPSVMLPEEYNYVINLAHKAFKNVKITAKRRIAFDKRIFTAK